MTQLSEVDFRRSARLLHCTAAGAALLALQACGGPDAPDLPDQAGIGLPAEKPGATDPLFGGGSYIVDPHGGGVDQDVFIEEVFWGRLVDVFGQKLDVNDSDGDGSTTDQVSSLVYPDLVIGQEVRTEPGRWILETNAVTGKVELTILQLNTDSADDAFDREVMATQANLVPVLAKGTDPGEVPPFSLVARNSAMVVRFSDLIDPDSIKLGDTLRLLVGAPPTNPFEARLLPDRNFGGIASSQNQFFSTRVIVDFTVSPTEQAESGTSIPANGLGLPASLLSFDAEAPAANVALKLPTREVPAIGQFNLLTNLSGTPLSDVGNGPVDLGSLSNDVTRAFRSGNSSDVNNGFLADLEAPQLVAEQPVTLIGVADDPNGLPGFDFVVELNYAFADCGFNPAPGDLVRTDSGVALTVTQQASTVGGIASGVRVSAPEAGEPQAAAELGGQGLFSTVLREELIAAGLAPCFLSFSPAPAGGSLALVDPGANVIVKFSEPMDPASGRPFDSFEVTRTLVPEAPIDWIVGEVRSSAGLDEMTFDPTIALPNPEVGGPTTLVVRLRSDAPGGGLRDLAGNPLELELPAVEFGVNSAAAPNSSQGYAIRFSSNDEILINGGVGLDWAGQFTYNLQNEEIRPRAVDRFSTVVDDLANPIVGRMQQLVFGLQTPLSNLGSKAHLMWRYADMGFTVSNFEFANTNLDVEGLALTPQVGSVVPTNYDQFQIVLGHSKRMPDEITSDTTNDPVFQFSGYGNNASFANNFLDSSTTPNSTVVHERNEGFVVSNLETFVSATNATMIYMPLNRGKAIEDFRYFTWRDTSILERGAFRANNPDSTDPEFGIPFNQEVETVGVSAPTEPSSLAGSEGLVGDINSDGVPDVGWAWGNSEELNRPPGIPTVGLPLLMEYSCYPSEALSLNNLRSAIAVSSSAAPFFRAFSTGGFDQGGNEVFKDPDQQPNPTGGFNGNPIQPPIGQPTLPRDPTVYYGQVDFVVRVSRAYSQVLAPDPAIGEAKDFVGTVLEPAPQFQPLGTNVTVAYRGTGNTRPDQLDAEIDGANLDLYGDAREDVLEGDDLPPETTVLSAIDDAPWSGSIDSLDGQLGFQLRLTFVSNPVSSLSPTLSSIGVAMRAL